MEIADFAEITYQVLQDTPLESYIPTLCLPAHSQIQALRGVPPEEEEKRIREIALEWAESSASENEEFLVAFRDGAGYFRIIRRSEGMLREALYPGRRKT
jgi:hypothetical protein